MRSKSMAGSDLDFAVARDVLGWRMIQAPRWDARGELPDQGKVLAPSNIDEKTYEWPPIGLIPPGFFIHSHYSTDIRAAMEIADVLVKRGYFFHLSSKRVNGKVKYEAIFGKGERSQSNLCDTQAEAICLAALRVMRSRRNKKAQ